MRSRVNRPQMPPQHNPANPIEGPFHRSAIRESLNRGARHLPSVLLAIGIGVALAVLLVVELSK